MLNLTASERQTLTGPLVLGSVLGAFVGLASWGFDSEYAHIDHWHMAIHALVSCLASVSVAALPLAVLPIAIQRLRRARGSTQEE